MSAMNSLHSPEELEALAALRPSASLSGYGLKIKNWIDENEGKRAFNAVRTNDTLELNMLDVIGQDWWTGGGITSDAVKAKLDANPDAKTIKVLMNTPGGDVWEGVSIRSLLSRHGARVEIEVIGLCASAGTIIAMSGDTVSMHEGTMFMVHRAWTFAMGNAVDLGKVVNFLTKIDSNIVDLYQSRTGRDRGELEKLINDETWMTAHDAVAEKFATSVIPANKGASEPPKQKAKAMAQPKTEQSPISAQDEGFTDEEREFARQAVESRRVQQHADFLANHPLARARAASAPPLGGMHK